MPSDPGLNYPMFVVVEVEVRWALCSGPLRAHSGSGAIHCTEESIWGSFGSLCLRSGTAAAYSYGSTELMGTSEETDPQPSPCPRLPTEIRTQRFGQDEQDGQDAFWRSPGSEPSCKSCSSCQRKVVMLLSGIRGFWLVERRFPVDVIRSG